MPTQNPLHLSHDGKIAMQAIELARRKAEENLKAKEVEVAMYEQVGESNHTRWKQFLQSRLLDPRG